MLYLIEGFQSHLNNGDITEKEKELFFFVISHYSNSEFSTKDLEKDFRNVAYATVRAFVLKFEALGLLSVQKYGQRNKYKLAGIVNKF